MDDHPLLLLSYSGALGGAERILLDHATRLGRPALLACPEGPLADAARDAGVNVTPVAARSLHVRAGARAAAAHTLGLAGLARDATRLARRARPPVVVAWGIRAVLAAARAPLGAPVLAVHNDLLPAGVIGRAARAATARCAGVVALSHAIAVDAGAAARATVLHPGVDLERFAPTPRPDGPPRALWLGALVGWKRPDLAMEIAAAMPELRLDIGGAPLPGDSDALAASLHARASAPDLRDRVRLLGAVDARTALAAASCLLHTADAEPYGLVLVEALASGRPVVAPAAGGPVEILRGGGGRLFPPGDVDAAIAALRDVCADPAAGAAARTRAESAFSIADSAVRFRAAVDAVAR